MDTYALLGVDNQLSFVRATYTVSFSDGVRKLTPAIEYPFANSSLDLGDAEAFDVQLFDSELLVVAAEDRNLATSLFRNVEVGYPLSNPRTSQQV